MSYGATGEPVALFLIEPGGLSPWLTPNSPKPNNITVI